MKDLYEMIFKRKSIRKYDEDLHVSKEELDKINEQLKEIEPLIKDIKIEFKIVKREETTAKHGEYCLLMYSENKAQYLLNAGYMLEQIDLFMASINIGACWYGMAKAKESNLDGLDYVIMISFGKSGAEDFRSNFLKTNRKDLKDIWKGKYFIDIAKIVRYAPSACNSQPWIVQSNENKLIIYRKTKLISIMGSKQQYFNSIDMGIFLLFLDITLNKMNYKYQKELCKNEISNLEYIEVATYTIK